MTQALTNVTESSQSLQAMPLQQVMQFKNDLDQTIKQWLVDGVDYAPMPNARKGPKVLLKSGAEKLCVAFGLRADYEIIEQTIDHNVAMSYKTRYESGEALGLYRYVIKCRLRDRHGADIFSALGICSSTETKYSNRPRDVENTIIKMAQKRALVAAVLNGLAISGIFTQDLDEHEAPEPAPPRQSPPHRNAPPPQAAKAQAPVASTPKAFDKNNKSHQDAFMKLMEKYNVPFDKFDDIADAMHGRPSSDLESCIKEALGGDAQDQQPNAVPVAGTQGVSETVQAVEVKDPV